MVVLYVDDTIIAGLDSKTIDELVKDLGVNNQDYIHNFQLRDEGEVSDFLCIKIENTGIRQFYLTQTGLIHQVLKAQGMKESHLINDPGTDTNLELIKM